MMLYSPHSSQGFLGHLLRTSAAGIISNIFKMSTRQTKLFCNQHDSQSLELDEADNVYKQAVLTYEKERDEKKTKSQ